MQNEVTKKGGKTLNDVKRARVKHPAMDFVGTLQNIADIINRHNDKVPQEPNGNRGIRKDENKLLRQPHAAYLKTCVEMLHEFLKQRRDDYGYNLKPGESIFIRTSNPKMARWGTIRGRRVSRSLDSLILDYNRIAELTGRDIIWKISYGPSRDFEIHFNPQVIKWHNDTLEAFDPFVAELTVRYQKAKYDVTLPESQSFNAYLTESFDPNCSQHAFSKHERVKKADGEAEQPASPELTADPASPEFPLNTFVPITRQARVVEAVKNAGGAMSQIEQSRGPRNSTTSLGETGVESTHGESIDPRNVRLLEAAERLTSHALAQLFLPHIDEDRLTGRQLEAIRSFHFDWLNRCDTTESEASAERYLRLMIDVHAVECRRKIRIGVWYNGMQLPTAYYGPAERAGHREALALMKEFAERANHRKHRADNAPPQIESEAYRWIKLKNEELRRDPRPKGWKPRKRTDNTQRLGDLLTSFRSGSPGGR